MKRIASRFLGIVGILAAAFVISQVTAGWRSQTAALAGAIGSGPRNQTRSYSESGYCLTPLSQERIKELARTLTPEEAHILLKEGTERAFTGALLDNRQDGLYTCRLCGLPLFSSTAKFKSGTGWPSFFEPIDPDHVHYKPDQGPGWTATEIECARCSSHLGHVFDDGPKPTGRRYCLNSAALDFYKKGADLPPESKPVAVKTAYFAGGCFWGIEDRFQQLPGVIEAISGYQGGHADKPTYKQVCSGSTGHAETVRVTFDPARISYRQLLQWFFKFHDATQLNRQGPDVGSQYRSAIFAADDGQLQQARAYVEELQRSEQYRGRKIVTQIAEAGPFFEAEAYHQDYHARHGGSCTLPSGP